MVIVSFDEVCFLMNFVCLERKCGSVDVVCGYFNIVVVLVNEYFEDDDLCWFLLWEYFEVLGGEEVLWGVEELSGVMVLR